MSENKPYSPAIRHARFCVGNTRFDLHIYFSPHLPADTDGEQSFVTIHNHFFNEIIFAEKGGLEVQAGERRLTLQQGDIIVFKKGFLHSLLPDADTRFLSLGFTFEKDATQNRQESTFPLFAKAFGAEYTVYRRPRLSARFAEIARRLEEPAQFSYYAVIALAQLFFIDAAELYAPAAADAPPAGDLEYVIETELHGAFRTQTLQELSRRLYMSERQLERIVKKLYGMSFSQKKRQLLMETAKFLLTEKRLTVEETAADLCYSSPAAFIAAFRKYTSLTPAQYRAEHSTPQ